MSLAIQRELNEWDLRQKETDTCAMRIAENKADKFKCK